ncbi:MAG: Asp-tRNA(Asn)/Glu-tRNA(Gln) amidotransferase subunit GatA [Bacteroidota bacterium]
MKEYYRLSEIQDDIGNGKISCAQLVEEYLSRIENASHLNAFTEVYADQAREDADKIDKKIKEGSAGKLAGLIFGIKDLLCHQDHSLTASSRILNNFTSQFTATSVQRLLDADAILIGRQNCDEFAMGSSNENSCYGPVRNPWNTEHVPGGSSGGSAAAVAANLCHVALASDTGGSIRQPAAFCGMVGLKPTYGRVSRWGLASYASSLDQVGPICRSVEDSATLLEVISGPDGLDNTLSHTKGKFSFEQHPADKPLKIGFLKEAIENESLDPEIQAYIKQLLAHLKGQGHEVYSLDFPYQEYVVPCYYILTPAEASSNLQRYDGVRYGHRSEEVDSLEGLYTQTRTEAFGEEVKRRIMLGTFVLSAGHYDAYYTQAMKVRRLIRDNLMTQFETCDFILMPTTPSPAFRIGEKSEDPVAMYLSDVFTVTANLAGICAISLPLGLHSSGLPFGVQLMAPPFEESKLLSFSQVLTSEAQQLPNSWAVHNKTPETNL